MKHILRRLTLVCSALVWAISCHDKDHTFPVKGLDSYTAANIDNQTQEEKYAYTEKHLTTLASGIAQLQDNPLFLELLYKEVGKGTWGENCALFSTLFEQAEKKSVNLLRAMLPAVNEHSLQASVFAFSGIDEKVYYPQIFIPNFKERGNPAARTGAISPVIVIFNGKSSPNGKYPAYQKNAQGKLEPLGFKVDEAYAEKNEVWVISLNENAVGTFGNDTCTASIVEWCRYAWVCTGCAPSSTSPWHTSTNSRCSTTTTWPSSYLH